MKKLLILMIAALPALSCNVEDDSTRIEYQYASITAADLPEFFEQGKIYEVNITYQLPTACHNPAGIDAKRGGIAGEERRHIYVVGVATYTPDAGDCTREADEEDLLAESSFTIRIDENQAYEFYLWTGMNDEMESQYTIVEVPVVNATGVNGSL